MKQPHVRSCAEPSKASASPLEHLRVLRRRGRFVVGVEREGSERLVVAASDVTDGARARARLLRLAEAHQKCDAPAVAAVSELGDIDGRPFVAFACSARADFQAVMDSVARSGESCAYAQGVTWVERWFDALRASARADLCFGALCPANMFVSADGEMTTVGLGDNVLALGDDGRPLRDGLVYAAPEVAASGTSSASGDLYAFTLFVRAVIPFVSFPEVVERVLSGDAQPALRELLRLFGWVSSAILAKPRAQRATIEEAWHMEQRAWELLELEPDRAGYRAFLRRHLVDPRMLLHVDEDVSSVSVGGAKRISLRTRRPLRRVLKGLIEQHQRAPGAVLSTLDLAALGWPDERLRPEAAASRVYVALSSLRAVGLGEMIQRYDGGFRIDPDVRVYQE